MENITTSEWIDLPLADFQTKRKVIIKGKPVDVFVSPYDIPKAMRAYIDKNKEFLVLEFRYLNEESTETEVEPENKFVTFVLGKSSRRLYAIKFDLDNLRKNGDIKLNLTKRDKVFGAVNVLVKNSDENSPKDNYELVKDAMRAKESQLMVATF